MQSVVTTIIVWDLLCNVVHSLDLKAASRDLKAAAHAAGCESVLCLILGIGPHLTNMLTSRRANVAALALLQLARPSRLAR